MSPFLHSALHPQLAILHRSKGQDASNTMEIKIVREAITKAELNEMAKQQFGVKE
jgi:hypothetical protein